MHKTSKQIARELGISHHTVDQRVVAARRKFGVETRNELAAAYMVAQAQNGDVPVYEKSVYQFSQVANLAPAHDDEERRVRRGFGRR